MHPHIDAVLGVIGQIEVVMSPSDAFDKGRQTSETARAEVQRQRENLISVFSTEQARLERLANVVRSRIEASGFTISVYPGAVGEMDMYFDDDKITLPCMYLANKKSGHGMGYPPSGYYRYNHNDSVTSYEPKDDNQILEELGAHFSSEVEKASQSN